MIQCCVLSDVPGSGSKQRPQSRWEWAPMFVLPVQAGIRKCNLALANRLVTYP